MNAILPICTCPTCGQSLPQPGIPLSRLHEIGLSPPQITVCRMLARAYPDGVQWRTLADAVYSSDPNGGPDRAAQSIRQMVRSIRLKAEPYGWTIPRAYTGHGMHAEYRIARVMP